MRCLCSCCCANLFSRESTVSELRTDSEPENEEQENGVTNAYKEHMPATTVEEKAAVNAAKEAKKEKTKREEAAKKAMQNPVSTGGGTDNGNLISCWNLGINELAPAGLPHFALK